VLTALVLMAIGAGLLVAGSEAFAEHIVPASRTIGLSAFGLAALVAGAEPEEAWTASVAAWRDRPDLAIGDALGANLVIATVTLGLLAVVTTLVITPAVRRYALVAAATAVLALLTVVGGTVARPEGIGLIAVYLVLVGLLWRVERRPPSIGELVEATEEDEEYGTKPTGDGPTGTEPAAATEPSGAEATVTATRRWLPLLMVVVGLVTMVIGGLVVVSGAERLVTAAGRSDSAIGLTVLALATSAEMLALVWSARRRGMPEIALAGTLGAIAYNSTFSLGLAAVVRPLEVGDQTGIVVVTALVVASTVGLAMHRGPVRRWVGGVLIVAYAVTVAWLLR
jgi:cation:H+ antiporter